MPEEILGIQGQYIQDKKRFWFSRSLSHSWSETLFGIHQNNYKGHDDPEQILILEPEEKVRLENIG